MALFINNQLIDFGDSPGILASNTINANSYPVGTILFDTGLVQIFRNQGTIGSQSWVNYSGGGAGQNLQTTLQIGNVSNDLGFTLFNTSNGQFVQFNTDTIFIYKDNLLTKFTKIDYESYGISNDNVSTIFNADNFISTEIATGISTSIKNDVLNYKIETIFDTQNVGIILNFGLSKYAIGDHSNFNNNNFILIDDNISKILFRTDKLEFSGVLTQGSAGSTSGQHLKVTINGVDYVIELRNP